MEKKLITETNCIVNIELNSKAPFWRVVAEVLEFGLLLSRDTLRNFFKANFRVSLYKLSY